MTYRVATISTERLMLHVPILDAFEPAHWIHDSPELNDDNVALHHFPDISPRDSSKKEKVVEMAT